MVNVLTGDTDCGKSAAMQGFQSLFFNNPNPSSLVRWGQDDLKVSSVIDGHNVSRVIGKSINQYILDKEKLSAIKQYTVPERVSELFNMGDINFERQLDPLFLVQSSPGEVARFFNKTLQLDEIDILATNLASNLRQANRDYEDTKKEIASLEVETNLYDIYDKAQNDLNDLICSVDAVHELRVKANELGGLIDEAETYRKKYISIADVSTGHFQDDILHYEIMVKELKILEDVLDRSVSYQERIEKIELELKDMEHEYAMGAKIICPTCGRPLGNGKDK
jgi:signal transduction histidine kinase